MDRDTPSTTPDHTRRAPLDREQIVAAGIGLADDEGVGALTMRRLAERLGFKVMALYNHVASKDELLALMVDAVAGSIGCPPVGDDPLGAVRAHAIATHDAFVRHPWSPALWQRFLPGPNRIAHMEYLLATLDRSGLPPEVAHHGFHAINNHVLGYSLQAQAMDFDPTDADAPALIERFLASVSADTHPHTVAHVQQHLDGDNASSFELVLDFILAGLRAVPDR